MVAPFWDSITKRNWSLSAIRVPAIVLLKVIEANRIASITPCRPDPCIVMVTDVGFSELTIYAPTFPVWPPPAVRKVVVLIPVLTGYCVPLRGATRSSNCQTPPFVVYCWYSELSVDSASATTNAYWLACVTPPGGMMAILVSVSVVTVPFVA